MRISELGGRDVAILGTGAEGHAAWRRLREHLPRQPLTLYTEAEQAPGWVQNLDPYLDRLVTGPLDGDRLRSHEVLLRSPGISPYRDALRSAREAGVIFTSGSSLWLAEHPGARTVAITGTKGKSTTAALTAHLLSACGTRAAVAGNIGRPLLECDADEADWWVIELSSYQICDLDCDAAASPSLVGLLNLSDEHLDWHRGAGNYHRDKLRLARLAPPGRLLVNHRDAFLREALADLPGLEPETLRQAAWFEREDGFHTRDGGLWHAHRRLLDGPPPGLPGRHNLSNLAAALALAELAQGELPESLLGDLAGVLASWRGLPHRIEPLGLRHGLDWYDDSLSTTPVATLAALEALGERPVTVLVGGLDRGLDWSPLAERFAHLAPHAVIGMPDSGPRIIEALREGGLAPPAGLHVADSLVAAVTLAREQTPAGGVVLLSPGAPSFPRFRDYRERGACFREAAGFREPDERPLRSP